MFIVSQSYSLNTYEDGFYCKLMSQAFLQQKMLIGNIFFSFTSSLYHHPLERLPQTNRVKYDVCTSSSFGKLK